MEEIAVANRLREMAAELRGSARSTELDENSLTRMLLAAAELIVLAEKIESGFKKPAMTPKPLAV